jgi:hypothetical protein
MTDNPRPMDLVVADLRARRLVVEHIEAELREAKQLLAESEDEILVSMQAQGINRLSSQGLTLSITESIVPQIKDWNAFEKFLLRNGATHLIERRIHTTAWREEVAEREGTPIPGVEPYLRIRLSVRAE